MQHHTIGFDAKRLFTNFRGLGNYSRTLVANLATYFPDNQYILYTPTQRPHPETAPFVAPPYRVVQPRATVWGAWWRTRGIGQRLSADGVKLYHGLSHELPQGRWHVPAIVTMHDLIYRVLPQLYSPADRALYDYKYRQSCRRADHIVAISEHTKRDLCEQYGVPPAKVTVAYQACQPTFYDWLSDDDARAMSAAYRLPSDYLLFVGSAEPRKNALLVVEALARLPNSDRLPLVMVGGASRHDATLHRAMAALGLPAHYLFHLPQVATAAHLQALYRTARALVYPSHYEGFGLPIVEALLSRTPVVASHAAAMPEAGGAHAYYVAPTDADALAVALHKILTDSYLRKTMTENGYTYAHHQFSPQRTTTQLASIYTHFLG